MDINQFISEVNAVDWNSFTNSVYSYYKPENVPAALIALAVVESEFIVREPKGNIKKKQSLFSWLSKEKQKDTNPNVNFDVCHSVLTAIGNNHRGTYYAVVREALPFIMKVALSGNHLIARYCALEILYTLCIMFCPEDWSDEKRAEKLELFVKNEVKNFILENAESIEAFGNSNELSKQLANELMEI